jgi:putative glycosyltransferase (exosortase G-associated)
MTHIINPFFYWLAWIIIPLIVEVIPSIGSFFILLDQRRKNAGKPDPAIWPDIVLVIPVYNSENSLEACLQSINDSDYPNEHLDVYLVNNMSTDRSFEVFQKAQAKFHNIRMQWLNAEQGKSRALNLAIYNSEGKYLINIDSDGILEKSALTRMVRRLEENEEMTCLTGSILIDPKKVEEYTTFKSRLLRKLEFVEYAQAFLAGRNYASKTNSMYTLSGAFSAFRMSSIGRSHLYNTQTISEDTEITFQMRYLLKQKVGSCVDAIYYTDPIEGVDKLYTQRQRWQRGSLEVANLYPQSTLNPWRFVKDTNIKTLLFDHTFAFPRMIWYLALIVLMAYGYSSTTVLLSMGAIFLFYIFCGYLYFYIGQYLLKPFPDIREYYRKQWAVVALLPFYNFVVFFIRLAGIINSINTTSSWKTDTLTREFEKFRLAAREQLGKVSGLIKKFRELVNYEEEYYE